MNRPLEEIDEQRQAADRKLADIAEGRVVEGDPAALEEQLLDELDELEYEAGRIVYPNFRSELPSAGDT